MDRCCGVQRSERKRPQSVAGEPAVGVTRRVPCIVVDLSPDALRVPATSAVPTAPEQVLSSALRTKSALMQSVQDVMQQDMSGALQTFSHEPTGAPGFMLSVGQQAGRSSSSDRAQPNTRVPYGAWFSRSEHAGTSSTLPSRRDPSSSTFTAADAIRCVNENSGNLEVSQRVPKRLAPLICPPSCAG
jgi:hypothetical protein